MEYDPEGLDLAASLQAIQEILPELGDLDFGGDGVAGVAAWLTQPLDGARHRSTSDSGPRALVDMRSLIPLSLAALGVGRFLAGNRVLPRWFDFLWFAFSTHQMLNQREAGSATAAGPSPG